jgi:hypothetical protein
MLFLISGVRRAQSWGLPATLPRYCWVWFSADGFPFGSEQGNLGFKIRQGIEGSIDGSETKIGNFVQFA